MPKNIALATFVICTFASIPAFALPSILNGAAQAVISADKDCKSDKPCDRDTLQECKDDLLKNVCPKPDRTCPVLYFDWNGQEYSVTCPASPIVDDALLLGLASREESIY